MKLDELIGMLPVLREFGKLKLPAKVYYTTVEVIRQAETENQKINEARLQCIINHGGEEVPDKPGAWSLKDPEQIDLATKEMDELMSVEVEVKTINLVDLGNLELEPEKYHALVGTFIVA